MPFLPHDNDHQRPADQGSVMRVLAVGDCNTCGITVPPVGSTILDKFCEHLEGGGYATERQNLGVSMATSREGVERMRRDAKPADVVIINFGLVDTWITSIPKFYVCYYPDTPLRKRMRKLLKFVKRRLRSPWLRALIPTGHVVSIDEYARNIGAMIAVARANNPRTTVLLWGSPPVQRDPARNANLSRYNGCLEDLAKETGASYLPTAPIIDSLAVQQAYIDAVHLSEGATGAIAAQLANVYQSQRLVA